MNFLLIYSHPNSKSFNHAILESLSSALRDKGQSVRIRDLYELQFDPILKGNELVGFQENEVPEDIRAEQEHIRWADVLIFICPIWWGSMPANLRGYFDRVFSLNFAYAETDKGILGLLKDKKALFISTVGAPREVYEQNEMFRSMTKTMDEVISGFCGMKMIEHIYFASVGTCSDQERQAMLERVREVAGEISANAKEG